MKKNINIEIAQDILKMLPDKKRQSLIKALDRNYILTSVWGLENCQMTIYKEGFYIELEGCRSTFSVFAWDRDGSFEIAERKPNESKLRKLYVDFFKTNNFNFKKIVG